MNDLAIPPPYRSTESVDVSGLQSSTAARRGLRSPLRNIVGPDDRYTTPPLGRRSTRRLEEGGTAHSDEDDAGTNPRPGGVLASILEFYHLSKMPETPEPPHLPGQSTPYPRSVASSRANSLDSVAMGLGNSMFRRRTMSVMSTGTHMGGLDDDDPRVTGAGRNDIDDRTMAEQDDGWDEKDAQGGQLGPEEMKEKAMIERNLKLLLAKQRFVLKLAKALMLYGAPSHRLESQLVATARVLAVPCQVIHFPGVVLLSFHDKVAKTSETHIVKATTRLMLGKLHTVHMIYRGVVHSEIGVQEGTDKLTKLIKAPPAYPTLVRCAIAFCCATIICLTSFGGSVLDALVAGWAGATLAYLQLHAVKRSVMYANIFEISTAIWVAFVARALSSWQGDYFCYSAISSAGVVLILPGFAVLCSALELASKNFISGSARLVWAVSYTLFLGFSLTAGSDLWFLLDSSARSRRRAAAASLTSIVYLNGTLTPNRNETLLFDALQQTLGTTLDGAWTFVNKTGNVSKQYHYQIVGCYRDPSWPWYRKPFPVWSLFVLVPLYCVCNSSWNLQPFRSKQLPVMVTISCFSYVARKTLQHFIGPRNEIVSAVGAFVIGVLGNVYARVFKGTAFTSMVTGVCFLVPSGLAAAGGLAMNYQGSDEDQYTSSIIIGVRMLSVAIGTTVGLLASSLVVYAFGPKKQSALFAF